MLSFKQFLSENTLSSAEIAQRLQEVRDEMESIDSLAVMIGNDPNPSDRHRARLAWLERDHQALYAIEMVLENNRRALKSPELLQSSIFLYTWDFPDDVVALHIKVEGETAKLMWIGRYGEGSAQPLLKQGMALAKERGAKTIEGTAKWESDGFYRRMGFDVGDRTSNIVGDNVAGFRGQL